MLLLLKFDKKFNKKLMQINVRNENEILNFKKRNGYQTGLINLNFPLRFCFKIDKA